MAFMFLKKIEDYYYLIEIYSGKTLQLRTTSDVWDLYISMYESKNKYLIVCDFEELPLECLYYSFSNMRSNGLLLFKDLPEFSFLNQTYPDISIFTTVLQKNIKLFENIFDTNKLYLIDSYQKSFYFAVLKYFLIMGLDQVKITNNRLYTNPLLYKEIFFEFNFLNDNEKVSKEDIYEFFDKKYGLDSNKIKNIINFFQDMDINLDKGDDFIKANKNIFFQGMGDFNSMFFKNLLNFDDFNCDNLNALNCSIDFGMCKKIRGGNI